MLGRRAVWQMPWSSCMRLRLVRIFPGKPRPHGGRSPFLPPDFLCCL
ncbi:hypothetical protein LEMLEM_LOCUS18740 [Lemmus lemmus]